jgi:hypothetical protein
MGTIKRIVRYSTVCLLLQGCVGAGIIKTHTECVDDPEVSDTAGPHVYPRAFSGTNNTAVYTPEWLEAHWGKPESVTRTGTNGPEIWTYRFGHIWQGIMPVVLIPIPIVLPVNREKVRFFLDDGRIIRATKSTQETVGGAFGFGFGPCGGVFGPFSLEGFPE